MCRQRVGSFGGEVREEVQGVWVDWAASHLSGRSSSIRVCFCALIRAKMSHRYVDGSIPSRFAGDDEAGEDGGGAAAVCRFGSTASFFGLC